MPHFFFNFRQGDEFAPDAMGIELPDVEAAYLEVFKAAQEMWGQLLQQRRDPRRCTFEVCSQAGDLLFVFPFQEVLDSCRDRKIMPFGKLAEQMLATRSYAARVTREFRREVECAHDRLLESRQLLRAMRERERERERENFFY